MRTRIKICGLTREVDVDAAVAAGADAIGFVFYPPSPRYVAPQRAAELVKRIPPFVDVVGLFVNEGPEVVRAACDALPINILQFHGDEDAAYCRQFSRPWLRAARVRPGLDLVEFAGSFPEARGLLLDAFVDAGFNAIDTADVYSRWVSGHKGGESEAVIGAWLRRQPSKRDRIVLATKVAVSSRTGLTVTSMRPPVWCTGRTTA